MNFQTELNYIAASLLGACLRPFYLFCPIRDLPPDARIFPVYSYLFLYLTVFLIE